jgi:methyl-accepting chemotaxis protein
MNIRRKLYLGFAIVLAFVITAQVISLVNLASIDAAFQDFERVQLKLAILADDIRYYDATLTDAVRAIIIDPQDKTHVERYNRDAEALDKALIDAEALATTAEDKQIFAAIAKDNVRMVEIERELIDKPDLLKAVEYYRGEYGQLKTSYANQVGLFYQHQQAAQQSQEDAIISRIGVMSASNIALGVVFILASIAVAIILSRNITLPLTQLTRAAQRVSDGDLTQRVSVTSKDEIGSLAQTFNSMSNNLQTTMASQVAKEYIEKVILAIRMNSNRTRICISWV